MTMVLVLATGVLPAAASQLVRLTMYDDGLSCPGGCDAHVVFHGSMNGTEFAHDPSTSSAPFAKCSEGKPCRICIESGDKQCLAVTYRGAGPTKTTFDLTPAFYEATCPEPDNPPALVSKCKELAAAAKSLDGRVNCIRTPDDAKCTAMIAAARAAQQADRVKYDECKSQGQAKYNAAHPAAERRSNDCAYEATPTGGPNKKGVKWRRLLPGACRTDTFVGRDGLDCCTGKPFRDGPLDVECRSFYPK